LFLYLLLDIRYLMPVFFFLVAAGAAPEACRRKSQRQDSCYFE